MQLILDNEFKIESFIITVKKIFKYKRDFIFRISVNFYFCIGSISFRNYKEKEKTIKIKICNHIYSKFFYNNSERFNFKLFFKFLEL